jgi:hypothetical protein
MDTLKDHVHSLNELIINDETLKAMELYYADNIEMQENEEAPRIGKSVCIEREKKTLGMLDLKSQLLSQAIDQGNNVVFSEWKLTITNRETKAVIIRNEVSVQYWRDGLLEKEKFYYNKV